MMLGIDAVEIARFQKWHLKSYQQLLRIFSPAEIDYCLHYSLLSAQRFAVRFAAKEALYKALAQQGKKLPVFLTFCTTTSVAHAPTGFPFLMIDWEKLEIEELYTTLSLSHTHTVACAVVFLAVLKK
jgi:phosphopantetheine--protein transferase-like protein